MIDQFYNYNGSLSLAKQFYRATANDNCDAAKESLNKFFNYSAGLNPCVARMSIQQAQNEVFLEQFDDLLEEKITGDELTQRTNGIKKGMYTLNHDKRLSDLDKQIKTLYPKSAKKRLALIPCIMDSTENGLALVRPRKIKGKVAESGNDIIEPNHLKNGMQESTKRLIGNDIIEPNHLKNCMQESTKRSIDNDIIEPKYLKKLFYFMRRFFIK